MTNETPSAERMAAAIEALNNVITITERNIVDLEAAIEAGLNKGRFVILMDSSVIAACQEVGAGKFNFAAMGTKAHTFTERGAHLNATHFERETGRTMHVMPVYPFYQQALESARSSLAFYRETIKDHS